MEELTMEKQWAIRLIRFAAIFGLFGTYLGSHMAGAGSYALKAVHVHILLVGWLSMFAWGIFYKNYEVRIKKLVTAQAITGMIGAFGLGVGMWLFYVKPFAISEVVNLVFFIAGGTILLISFALFLAVTFFIDESKA